MQHYNTEKDYIWEDWKSFAIKSGICSGVVPSLLNVITYTVWYLCILFVFISLLFSIQIKSFYGRDTPCSSLFRCRLSNGYQNSILKPELSKSWESILWESDDDGGHHCGYTHYDHSIVSPLKLCNKFSTPSYFRWLKICINSNAN